MAKKKTNKPPQSKADAPKADAPKAIALQCEVPINLEAAVDGETVKRPTFEMQAYHGGAMRVAGFYRPVVIDLAGLRARQATSILLDHDERQVVGQSTKVEVTQDQIRLAGVITGDDEPAQKVVGHARNGFVWSASVGVDISKLESVPENTQARANGKIFSGPLLIARQGRLGEVSFVAVNVNLFGSVTVIWDDGSRDVFTLDSGEYVSPPGVFWTLEAEGGTANPTGYMLTHKSQIKNHFHADGTLDYVADASVDYDDGQLQIQNRVTCTYYDAPNDPWDGKLYKVTDAAGRELTLTYNSYGKLMTITDPLPGTEQRTWTLHHVNTVPPNEGVNPEGGGAFTWFELPPEVDQEADPEPNGDTIRIGYNAAGRITWMQDLNDEEYTLAFAGGQISSVTNPLSQTVSFAFTVLSTAGGDVLSRSATYTDVRNNDWSVTFDPIGNLIRAVDPLSHQNNAAYEDTAPDLVHEVTSVTNALGKTWTTTYDDEGNVLSVTDPLSHTTTFTYTNPLYGPARLESVTPVGITAKMTQFEYEDPYNPTKPTAVVMPADGQGNPAADISLAYYGDEAPNAYGLLRSVEDANGVYTLFEYDQYGTQWRVSEGAFGALLSERTVRAQWYDELGRFRNDLDSFTGENPEIGDENDGERAAGCKPAACRNKSGSIETVMCGVEFTVWAPPNAPKPKPLSDVCSGDCYPLVASETLRQADHDWGFPCPPDTIGNHLSYRGSGSFTYDGNGNLLTASSLAQDSTSYELVDCSVASDYDVIGRPLETTLTSSEQDWYYNDPGVSTVRSFEYDYYDTTGIIERLGPDGQTTRWELDSAGRLSSVRRGPDLGDPASPILSADYTYYANNQVEFVTYGDGSRVHYLYDDAGRLDRSRHEWAATGNVILDLDYTLSVDGLITQVAETGPNGWAATVTYTYDNRNQLIGEQRVGTHPYHLTYAYDQMGNRKSKTDHINGIGTSYYYDYEDVATYGTQNNRLMRYDVFDSAEWIESVYYEYSESDNNEGHVSRIVHETPGEGELPNEYHSVDFTYDKVGEVRFAVQTHWTADALYCDDVIEDRIDEFRGRGRVRYMTRERHAPDDPNDPDDFPPHRVLPETAVWSDYSGDAIYGDYEYDQSLDQAVEVAAYLPGIGQIARVFDGVAYVTRVTYFHSDQVGSLRATSDAPTIDVGMVVYTAFGEEVHADGTVGVRYRYGGVFGYQANEGLPYIHIGARYYDPSTGRFLQRDSIGILGGLNVYVYAYNMPTMGVDPTGQGFVSRLVGSIVGGAVAGAIVGAVKGAIVGAATGPGIIAAIGAGAAAGALAGGLAGAVSGVGNGLLASGRAEVYGSPNTGMDDFTEGLISGGISGLGAGVAGAVGGAYGCALGGGIAGGLGSAYGGGDWQHILASACIGAMTGGAGAKLAGAEVPGRMLPGPGAGIVGVVYPPVAEGVARGAIGG